MLLAENAEPHAVMASMPGHKEIVDFANALPDDIIYNTSDGTYGRTTAPHVTILYGISPESEPIAKSLIKQMPNKLVAALGNISMFEGLDYDVLKIDVESSHLKQLNNLLVNHVEYENRYNEYIPHVTIAYVKKGMGKNYVGDNRFAGKVCMFEAIVYSKDSNGTTAINEKQLTEDNGGGGIGSFVSTFTSPVIVNRGAYYNVPGNITMINPYNTLTSEDLNMPPHDPQQVMQGLRYEMRKMTRPDKTIARQVVKKNLDADARYYVDLHSYLTSNSDAPNDPTK